MTPTAEPLMVPVLRQWSCRRTPIKPKASVSTRRLVTWSLCVIPVSCIMDVSADSPQTSQTLRFFVLDVSVALAVVCLFNSADFYCHAGPFGWQVRWQCWCFSVRAGGDVPYRFGVLLVMLFGQDPEWFDEFFRTHSLNMPEYCLKLPSLEHFESFW